jgi:hypothetical protein
MLAPTLLLLVPTRIEEDLFDVLVLPMNADLEVPLFALLTAAVLWRFLRFTVELLVVLGFILRTCRSGLVMRGAGVV